jgi:peptide deformylase
MASKIVTYPDDVLRKVSAEVNENTGEELIRAIEDLWTVVSKSSTGVGLAAIQIGIPIRLFVMWPNRKGPPQFVANPRYLEPSNQATIEMMEGCLSFPGVFEKVRRFPEVKVAYDAVGYDFGTRYVTIDPVEKTLTGFEAHIFQHESDHLDGVVFIDYLDERNFKRIHSKMNKRKMKWG